MQAKQISFSGNAGAYTGIQRPSADRGKPVVQFAGSEHKGGGNQATKRANGAGFLGMIGIGCAVCAVGCLALPVAALLIGRHFLKKIPVIGSLIP